MGNAWDRLPEETELSYKGFITYLNLKPPRTTPKAVEAGAGAFSHRSALNWSYQNHWIERAAAYDTQVTDKVFTTRMTQASDFQDQIISDELEDYEKLRKVWQDMFNELMGNEKELSEKMSSIQSLVRTRQLIDSMGRKLAQMPNTYAGKANDKSMPAGTVMITKEGLAIDQDG